MIVLATNNRTLAKKWENVLSYEEEIYGSVVSNKNEIVRCLKRTQVEFLILDEALLEEKGLHEISDLVNIQPSMFVIVFAKETSRKNEVAAILFGAKAYCQYDLQDHLFAKVIDTIRAGEVWVDRKFLSCLLNEIEDLTKAQHNEAQDLDKILSVLTHREKEIARLVADGASNRKIAEQLGISERTVKAHLGVIFRKMNIEDRLQLALHINRHKQIASIWSHKN